MCTDINNERRRSSVGFTSLQVVKPSSKYLSIDSFLTICTMHETSYIVHDTSPTTTFFLDIVADEGILLLKQRRIDQSGENLSSV